LQEPITQGKNLPNSIENSLSQWPVTSAIG
jgi:hypothetical protein